MSDLQSSLKSLFAQGTTLTKLNLPMRVAHEAAGSCRVIFVHMPEGRAIGRIDSRHAVIAPAPARVGLGTPPISHYGFPLREVI